MAVHRHEWENDFTVIPNSIFKDERLSLRDLGLLCFALSRTPDFDFSVRGLKQLLPNDGRRVIESCVKALKAAGYASGGQKASESRFQRGSFDISDLPCVHSVCAQSVQTPSVQTQSAQTPSVQTPSVQQHKTNELKTNKRKRGDKPQRTRFVPPTVEEVASYCETRRKDGKANCVDPEHFVDYYAARGWRYSGGQVLKDWRAAVRTWEHRDSQSENQRGSQRDNQRARVQEDSWELTDLTELDFG